MRKQVVAVGLLAAVVAIGVVVARGCGEGDRTRTAATSGGAKTKEASPGRDDAPPTVEAVAIVVDAGASDGSSARGPEVFFSAGWGGSRMTEVGRSRPEEGNPEAPMSLSIDGKGRMFVLDQVNGRVVRIGEDGKPEGVIPLKQQEAAQDLAISDDGRAAVLDRFNSKSIVMYDEKGDALGEIPLEGEGLENPGVVSGVFVDGKDVYVEKEHGSLLRIGTTDGRPAEDRGEIPGRPSRDGQSYIHAGITDAETGRMYVSSVDRATMEHKFTRELRQGAEIRGIRLLDTDKSGTIYIAVELDDGGPGIVVLSCLEPSKGFPVGSALLPVNTMPEETFRDFAVLDEGGVIYSFRTEEGVSYQKYDCQ